MIGYQKFKKSIRSLPKSNRDNNSKISNVAIEIHILEIKERNTGEIEIEMEIGIEILNLRRINSKKNSINQIKSNGLCFQ